MTLSPIETEIVARLLREVRGYYDGNDEKILAVINAAENSPEENTGTITVDDLVMLEEKVGI